MTRRLVKFVWLTDDEGKLHGFGPGDDVPAWAEPRITNPKVWGGDVPDDGTATKTAGAPPPRSGRGSGRDPWATYASTSGVDVPVAAGRDDIIALLDKRGVRTE